jgi:hypothetical protein
MSQPGPIPEDLAAALAAGAAGSIRTQIEVMNYQFALIDMDGGTPDQDGNLPRAMLINSIDASTTIVIHLPGDLAQKIGKALVSTPPKRASGLVVPNSSPILP